MSQAQNEFSLPNDRRRILIDATMSAISQHGFSNLTLAKISSLAGLTAGIVNFHFTSKDSLLLATLQRVADDLSETVTVALAAAGDDPADRLLAIVDASLDPQVTEHRKVAVWYAFMSEASARDDYQRICGDHDREYFDLIHELCDEIVREAGKSAVISARAIAQALSGLVDELWQEILFADADYDRKAARDQCCAFLASVFPWCFVMPREISSEVSPDPYTRAPLEVDGLVCTLPAWCYSSSDFFALEKEHLFLPAWHLVCHTSDLPEEGSFVTFELLNERAFVVRRSREEIAAYHNVCPHRAHSLVAGEFGQCPGRVSCPYHGWTFNFAGQRIAISSPESFRTHGAAAFGLKPIECEIYRGFVFIRFRGGGVSVRECYAPVDDEFAHYRTEAMVWADNSMERNCFWTEVVEVDWKNAVENFLEDYHFPLGHKGLSALMKKAYDREHFDHGMARLSHELRDEPRQNWSAQKYHNILPMYEHLPASLRRRWTYYAAFPGTFFDIFPEKMDFFQMIPLAPGKTMLRGRSYALPDDDRRTRAAQYLSHRINRRVQAEDNRLTAEVQKGLSSSSYQYGILSDKEVLVQHFQDWVRASVPVATLLNTPDDVAKANGVLSIARGE